MQQVKWPESLYVAENNNIWNESTFIQNDWVSMD